MIHSHHAPEPIASEPIVSPARSLRAHRLPRPTASGPATSDPIASEPTASGPATSEPIASGTATSEPLLWDEVCDHTEAAAAASGGWEGRAGGPAADGWGG